MTCDELIERLEDLTLPPAALDHRAHVRAGFTYLQRLGFAGALSAMAQALRRFAAHHGKQGLYHETVTAAFLALIHQRMAEDLVEQGTVVELAGARVLVWEDFAARHPELFAPDLLLRYYPKETLRSELARDCFVLPKAS
ncbi:hypothetical protein [Dongia deserti]|uniref:hypothetical protein n=1 Tax=Dongia deserti TaxID=2268030 RepID=UPI000E659D29|nr:hypothetical protein [Dongia deserti]